MAKDHASKLAAVCESREISRPVSGGLRCTEDKKAKWSVNKKMEEENDNSR